MEETVVKEGLLYLQQQQTFGKKWRKFWGVLHRESAWALAHLELLENSQPAVAEKAKKGEGSRHVIKLTDCVHVAEVPGDQASCPRETTPFLLETTEKCYLLAAKRIEVATWIMELCEHAFSSSSGATLMANPLKGGISCPSLTMAENSLYNTVCKAEQPFPVTLVATPTSERCQLRGRFLLRVKADALELSSLLKGEVLYSWPYQFLRRFGYDKTTFLFEAGRRCVSGEGIFEFATGQGGDILQAIDAAIRAQRVAGTQDSCLAGAFLACNAKAKGGAQVDKVTARGEGQPLHSASTRSLSLETDWQEKPGKGIVVKPTASCPLPRAEDLSGSWPRQGYGSRVLGLAAERTLPQVKVAPKAQEPFATISKPGLKTNGSLLQRNPEGPPASSPLNVRMHGLGQEHLYDDLDNLAYLVYDEPQEVKGEAWKMQATVEESVGHEYPPVARAWAKARRPVASAQLHGQDKQQASGSSM